MYKGVEAGDNPPVGKPLASPGLQDHNNNFQNQMILDIGHTNLMDGPLPKSFWIFANLWRSYFFDRILNQASSKLIP
ncbi:hypothetical protein VP01_2711g3 [Puccinia sorghi]|uniref:Uncharacterized protein n=1 Tax=Puccinia sorghi TaxID=27349 RepID=A0A0L6V5A3_9BASI|nr:hypothetical protein VP01_2711g3 [Puccinia sorghi]